MHLRVVACRYIVVWVSCSQADGWHYFSSKEANWSLHLRWKSSFVCLSFLLLHAERLLSSVLRDTGSPTAMVHFSKSCWRWIYCADGSNRAHLPQAKNSPPTSADRIGMWVPLHLLLSPQHLSVFINPAPCCWPKDTARAPFQTAGIKTFVL